MESFKKTMRLLFLVLCIMLSCIAVGMPVPTRKNYPPEIKIELVEKKKEDKTESDVLEVKP